MRKACPVCGEKIEIISHYFRNAKGKDEYCNYAKCKCGFNFRDGSWLPQKGIHYSMICPECGQELEIKSEWSWNPKNIWNLYNYAKCSCGFNFRKEVWFLEDTYGQFLICPKCGKNTMRCMRQTAVQVERVIKVLGYLYNHICMNEECGYTNYQESISECPSDGCGLCSGYYNNESSASNTPQSEPEIIDNHALNTTQFEPEVIVNYGPIKWIAIFEEYSAGPNCREHHKAVWESESPPSVHELTEAIGAGPCSNSTSPGCEGCTGSYITTCSIEKYTRERAIELGLENSTPLNKRQSSRQGY